MPLKLPIKLTVVVTLDSLNLSQTGALGDNVCLQLLALLHLSFGRLWGRYSDLVFGNRRTRAYH